MFVKFKWDRSNGYRRIHEAKRSDTKSLPNGLRFGLQLKFKGTAEEKGKIGSRSRCPTNPSQFEECRKIRTKLLLPADEVRAISSARPFDNGSNGEVLSATDSYQQFLLTVAKSLLNKIEISNDIDAILTMPFDEASEESDDEGTKEQEQRR